MALDAIVIGAGHNGLVAASLLAKAGLKTLVLERTDRVGGGALTRELTPGFRCPALTHSAAIDPAIVRMLDLDRYGLRVVRPSADVCAPRLDSRALVLWHDRALAAREIHAFSAHDAEQYSRFLDSFGRIAGVLRVIASMTPPDIDRPGARDILELIKTGRRFRALGRANAYRLLRWMSMPVADLVGEWFETDTLAATIAAGGILGSLLGPWSAGSAALLMLLGAGEAHPVARGWLPYGGPGAVADALAAAARSYGAEIRTGIDVARIEIADGVATGVITTKGEAIAARAIVSNADPKRTLLGLVDPMHLAPGTIRRLQHLRGRGTLAKVNYAVSEMPRFSALSSRDSAQQAEALSGRIRFGDSIQYIERAFDAAKYGTFSDDPWIEMTVPSILDRDLAPAGRHVVSAYVQYAPYDLRGATWDIAREQLGDVATRTITRRAPRFDRSIIAREVITPLDLERTYGLTGGHIFHGEIALDQFFITRPLLGWARYTTPIRKLFLCGSGTHPGTGLNGRSGANAAREILAHLARDRAGSRSME